jgi:hypothetical protein
VFFVAQALWQTRQGKCGVFPENTARMAIDHVRAAIDSTSCCCRFDASVAKKPQGDEN